jgi:light-regulated signal transduction histidine kinase (bacteriophytochrome)
MLLQGAAANGAEFDTDYADKLYVPFQRLRGTGELPGIGISLSTVYRIITRHGGKKWAEGYVGDGASLYVSLVLPLSCSIHWHSRTLPRWWCHLAVSEWGTSRP